MASPSSEPAGHGEVFVVQAGPEFRLLSVNELGETHLANESKVACATAMARNGDGAAATKVVEEVLESEGDDPFAAAVETTSTLLRCIEVLEPTAPERAAELRARAAAMVERRSRLISDPKQRASYLAAVESHRSAVGDG